MKRFHLTTYHLYSKALSGVKVAILSDVHFSELVSSARLDSITEFIRRQLNFAQPSSADPHRSPSPPSPAIILIPGDLIDSNNALDDPSERERLLVWLAELSQIAPLFISLGNHEFLREQNGVHIYDFDPTFWQTVDALENVTVLNNSAAKFPDQHATSPKAATIAPNLPQLRLIGLTLPKNYYAEGGRLGHPAEENRATLLEFLNRPNIRELLSKKAVFTLVHSPVFLHDQTVLKHFTNTDYLISGHLHGGLVPPILSELLPGERGIVAPGKQLFPPHTRHVLKDYSAKLIVTPAVTTFGKLSKLAKMNAFFPTYLTLLCFTNDQKYLERPYHQHKYML